MNSLEFTEWYSKMVIEKKEPKVTFEVYPDEVPNHLKEYVTENTMTILFAPTAIRELIIAENDITFTAAFNKKAFKISYPYDRILEVSDE